MVLSCIVCKRKVNMDVIFLSAGKCLTTRRRLTEIASLVYLTSLFYCLINQSEFAIASVRRGEQNGVIIAGVPFLLSPIPSHFFPPSFFSFLHPPPPRPLLTPATQAMFGRYELLLKDQNCVLYIEIDR